MKTYAFKIVLEKDKWPDEPDEKAVWRAYIPALEHKGAASWGYTEKEALENLQNAVDLLTEYMQEVGESLPGVPRSQVQKPGCPSSRITYHVSRTTDNKYDNRI